MIKRSLAILLAGTMILSLATACGKTPPVDNQTSSPTAKAEEPTPKTEESTPPAEAAKIQLVFYGDESNRMKEFADNELAERLKADLNVELTLTHVPWSEYGGGKIDLMLATGEDFASYTDPGNTSKNVAKGMFADLTQSANQYLPDLKKAVKPEAFDSFTFDGKLYAVPIGNKPNSAEGYCLLVRQDLLEEVGMQSISSIEDFEKFYDLCKAKHPDYVGFAAANNLGTILSYQISDKNIELIDNGNSDQALAFTDASANDDKVYSWYESEEFKKQAEIAHRWYKKGIIPQYVLTNPSQSGTDFQAGKTMAIAGTAGKPLEEIDKLKSVVPNAELVNYFLGSGKAKINRQPWSTAYFVSAASENVDAYMRLLNYMQQNRDNVDFLTYGVKGKDYELDGESVVKKTPDGFFNDWMLMNVNFMRFPKGTSDDFIKQYKSWDDGCIKGKAVGFTFNGESVKTEKAKLDAILAELAKPIGYGFVPYEGNYDKLIKKLKDAGLDTYMAEMQKQFSEFRATR